METARLALPLLAVAQAQKEVTHNEALVLIDALVQPVIEAGPTMNIPPNPAVGQCWLVAAGVAGAWTGQENRLAIWTDGGWRFAPPHRAMQVTRSSDSARLWFDGTSWIAPDIVVSPTGGAVVDTESRAAISALITILAGLGWVNSP